MPTAYLIKGLAWLHGAELLSMYLMNIMYWSQFIVSSCDTWVLHIAWYPLASWPRMNFSPRWISQYSFYTTCCCNSHVCMSHLWKHSARGARSWFSVLILFKFEISSVYPSLGQLTARASMLQTKNPSSCSAAPSAASSQQTLMLIAQV